MIYCALLVLWFNVLHAFKSIIKILPNKKKDLRLAIIIYNIIVIFLSVFGIIGIHKLN